jgi:hypothetical protein
VRTLRRRGPHPWKSGECLRGRLLSIIGIRAVTRKLGRNHLNSEAKRKSVRQISVGHVVKFIGNDTISILQAGPPIKQKFENRLPGADHSSFLALSGSIVRRILPNC